HIYATEMDFDQIGKTRTEVIKELKEQGIGTQVHYIPVHLQPYYRKKFGTGEGDCPSAEKYYKKALSIPLFPAMSNDDVMKVVKTVKNLKQDYPGDRQ
ncbi:MAG: DegT/DnrJ/EryC1/StrS family aminotransferase, partial [bacterium]